MKKLFLFTLGICLTVFTFAQYEIGHQEITFTDPDRGGREIPTDVYYPADTTGEDVTMADGQFNLIVFGHGFIMANPDLYTYIFDAFVPLGYIIAFPTTEGSMFPTPSHENFGLDLKFLNTHIKYDQNADANSFFYQKILEKSAIMGHSMGGKGTYIASANNTDITTMVSLAAAMSNPPIGAGYDAMGLSAPNVVVPTLVFDAEFDCVVPEDEGHKHIYDTLTTPCKTYINVPGGGHCYFASQAGSGLSACESGEGGCEDDFYITREQQNDTVLDFIVPYLNYYLKDDAQGLIDFEANLELLGAQWYERECLAYDVEVAEITAPVTNCLLSDQENITLTVKNNGSENATGFDLVYSINGATPVSEAYSGTLLAYDETEYTFTAPADLSAGGSYDIEAYVVFAQDENNDNDTVSVTVENLNTVVNLPIEVDFTDYNTNGDNLTTIFPDWYEGEGNTTPEGTTSGWRGITGLDDANNVTAKINMYNNPVNDWLVGPAFVATDLTSLKFKAAVTAYNNTNVYANGMPTSDFIYVMLSQDCGATWTNIYTIDHTHDLTNTLEQYEISLAAYEGASISIAFQAFRNTSNGADYDFHLDDINIFNRFPNDIGITQISTTAGSCNFTDNENVVVEITNYGNADQTGFEVAYVLNDGTPVVETVNDNLPGNETLEYTFTATEDLSQPGSYFIDAYTNLVGDQDNSNDTLVGVEVVNSNAATPLTVDFTSYNGSNLNSLFEGWYEMDGIIPTETDGEWDSQTGLEGTGNITARINLYTNTVSSWIVSPAFMANQYTTLSFDAAITAWDDLNAYASGMGSDDSVSVLISTDCGDTWSTLYTFNDTTTLDNTFRNHVFNLGNYAGQVIKLAFYGTDGMTDDSNDYDFHLDNINLTDEFPIDMEALVFTAPIEGSSCYTNTEAIKVTVTNQGTMPLDASVNNIVFDIDVAGANPQTYSVTVDTGTIAVGQTVEYTLVSNYDMLMAGNFTFNGTITVQGDENANNDTFEALSIDVVGPEIEIIGESPVCTSSPVELVVRPLGGGFYFENNTQYDIPDNNSTGVTSEITSTNTSNASDVVSVEVNITHTYDGDLTLYLYAPDGSYIILSQENGSGGDNYVSTVFTSDAATAITSGSAPFTGEFTPEEAFSGLTGTADGVWQLVVTDGANNDFGTIDSWSITFEEVAYTYEWSTTETNDTITVAPGTNETYTVTATDVCGLTTVESFDIEVVDAGTDVDLGADQEFCFGDSTVLDAGTGFDTYLWSDNSDAQTLTVTETGTYAVTVVNVCNETSIDTVEITVFDLPAVDLGADQEICEGETTTLDAGVFADYDWNNGEATTQTYDVDTEGEYIVEVMDDNTCINSDTVYITVNALPAVDLGEEVGLCDGASATLDAGAGFTSYAWSDGTTTTQTLEVTAAADYSVTVQDDNGCENADTVTVSERALPIVDLGSDVEVCEGDTTTFDAGAFNAYAWSTQDDTQTIEASTAGDYSVTVTDSYGCENADTIALIVNSLPAVDLGEDQEMCEGETTTLDAGAFADYDWNNGEATTQTYDVDTEGEYIVEVMDDNTCINSDTVYVTVNALPVVDLGEEVGLCDGASATLDAGADFASYAWSDGTTTTQTLEVTVAADYSVTVQDDNGCENADTVTVSERALPIVDLGSDVEVCEGDTTTFDAGTFDAYAWSTQDDTQTIEASIAGNYSVTVTDSYGCENADTIALIVNSLPAVDLGADQEMCEGETTTLDAGAFADYDWNNGEATTQTYDVDTEGEYIVEVMDDNTCINSDTVYVTVNALPAVDLGEEVGLCDGASATLDAGTGFASYAWSDGTTTTQTLEVTAAADYSVTVQDDNGCENADTVTVSDRQSPVVDLGEDVELCEGETATFDAGQGFDGYAWSNQEDTQTIETGIDGEYSVTVTDTYGCEGMDTVTLTVNPLPQVDLGADQNLCTGETVSLDAGNGFDSYLWNTGEDTKDITVTTGGAYHVVVSDNGCENSDTVQVYAVQTVQVELPEDTSLCGGDILTLDAGNNFTNYTWSTGGLDQVENIDTTGVGYGTFTVTVNVTDNNGCNSSDDIVVTFEDCTGIEFGDEANTLSIYPNPTKGAINIEATVQISQIRITDISGKEISLQNELSENVRLDLTQLPKGVYFVHVNTVSGNYVQKIILE